MITNLKVPTFCRMAHRGGSFTFQTIDRGESRVFAAIRIRKSADLIPDADIFCIIAVNSFLNFKYPRVAYKLNVFGKGGICYFAHPDGGGHAILSSRNRGGLHFFFLTPRCCLPPLPSAEIYEQSLNESSSREWAILEKRSS